MPVHQISEEIVKVVKLSPHEQVQQHTVEQLADVLALPIQQQVVEVVMVPPQERFSERSVEQIEGIVLPPIM